MALGPLPRINDLNVTEITAALAHDKKVAQGKIPFILPTRLGEVKLFDNVPEALVRAVLEQR